ncbi:MAG: glycoside hydrolase family 127 protein [Bacteroidales bacterium]|nr:MAG: glycoside hydrolase family 127 protein [Bacteroidales bacterium]
MKTGKMIYLLCLVFMLFPECKQTTFEGHNNNRIRLAQLKEVTVSDQFWSPRIETNRMVTIPYAFEKCEKTGRIDNFAKAGGLMEGEHIGERYNDTDVYKIIEGAAYSLSEHPDPVLEHYVDSLIHLIRSAQEEDGYLFTTRTINPEKPAPGAGRDRWIDVWVSHELYNAGHLYEAAVAWYEATGKKDLLDVAMKNADLVCDLFGYGRTEAAPGHQEIEIGLMKLFRITGNIKYLDQARFFLDVRGKPQDHLEHPPGTRFAVYNDLEYLQQHLPVLDQKKAVGHAVRAAYMYTAMTGLSILAEVPEYLKASSELWENVTGEKIYLTGGIGAVHRGEAFGEGYELPNGTAYNETCAAIGNIFWNASLFEATGESKYMDVLERTLFNGMLSGVSLDGKEFFYPNPLESDGEYERSPWFGVACCPGNVTRFLPRIPGYIYAISPSGIYVNLFVESTIETEWNGNPVTIVTTTNYPWDGEVNLTVTAEYNPEFMLFIRIPGWTGKTPLPGKLYHFLDGGNAQVSFRINDRPAKPEIQHGYASIKRRWKKGDQLQIDIPMDIRLVMANERVLEDTGKVAIVCGPFVYAAEGVDYDGSVLDLVLPVNQEFRYTFREDLLGGIGLIEGDAIRPGTGESIKLKTIPYYAWANRGKNDMKVWFPAINR